MKKNICLLLIIMVICGSLIVILQPTNYERIESEENGSGGYCMPDSYYNYSKANDVHNDKYPLNTHLVFETSNGIYFVDSSDATKLYKTTDEGVTVTQVDVDPGDAHGGDNKSRPKNIYSGVQTRSINVLTFWDASLDSGNAYAWTIDTDDDSVTEVGNTGASVAGADVVLRKSTNAVAGFWVDSSGGNYFVRLAIPAVASQDMGVIGGRTAVFAGGVVVWDGTGNDDDYYFLWKWSDENVELWRYDMDLQTFTQIHDFGANTGIPSARNQQGITYDENDILSMVLQDTSDSKYYLWTYSISGDSATKGAEYNIALMLDRNTDTSNDPPFNLEKGFHITDRLVYQISKARGNIVFISDLTDTSILADGTLVAITDTYLFILRASTDVELWKFVDQIANGNIIEFRVTHDKEDYPTAKLKLRKDKITVSDGLFMQLIGPYSADGSAGQANKVIFEGKVRDWDEKIEPYQTVLVINQGEEMDDPRETTDDYTGRTDEIIEDDLLTEVNINYIIPGTLSVGAAMGTITPQSDKTYYKYFSQFKDIDFFSFNLRPTGEFDYNNGTVDSGADLRRDVTFKDSIRKVNGRHQNKNINKVIVKGAINPATGAPWLSSGANNLISQQEDGVKLLIVSDATLNTQALVDAKDDELLSREGANPLTVVFEYRKTTVGFVQPGQTITFVYDTTNVNIPSGQYIVDRIVYEAVTEVGQISCSSGLVFDFGSVQEQLPEENSQRIEQNASTVQSNQSTMDAHIALTKTAHGGLGRLEYDDDDPAAHDIDEGDLTMDLAWHEFDLDGAKTVPSGAIGFYANVILTDATAGAWWRFRDTSQSNVKQVVQGYIQVANRPVTMQTLIPLDSNNKFDYFFSEAFASIDITVLWWVY